MRPEPHDGAAPRFSPLGALAQLNPFTWATGLFLRGVAELKIPDELARGPRTSDQVADAVGADRASMARFLRACVVHGAAQRETDGRYTLTDLGQLLRSDIPSLRGFVIAVNGPGMVRPWERLAEAVRTGRSATNDVWGVDIHEYYAQHPEEALAYAESCDVLTIEAAELLSRAYDFARFQRIVDVGGSRGVLLTRVLKETPQAGGVLFELPTVVELARTALAEHQLRERIELTAGDFLAEVPTGGDLYLVKNVISDLADADAATLLANCLKAAVPDSRLLLVDWVLQPAPSFVDATDIDCLVLTGGKARTPEEYEHLLSGAGYTNISDVPLPGFEAAPMAVIEATRP